MIEDCIKLELSAKACKSGKLTVADTKNFAEIVYNVLCRTEYRGGNPREAYAGYTIFLTKVGSSLYLGIQGSTEETVNTIRKFNRYVNNNTDRPSVSKGLIDVRSLLANETRVSKASLERGIKAKLEGLIEATFNSFNKLEKPKVRITKLGEFERNSIYETIMEEVYNDGDFSDDVDDAKLVSKIVLSNIWVQQSGTYKPEDYDNVIIIAGGISSIGSPSMRDALGIVIADALDKAGFKIVGVTQKLATTLKNKHVNTERLTDVFVK